MCKAEKARGRQLLTTLAGLFVSNSDKDIVINFRDVELGWKVKDGKTKVGENKTTTATTTTSTFKSDPP